MRRFAWSLCLAACTTTPSSDDGGSEGTTAAGGETSTNASTSTTTAATGLDETSDSSDGTTAEPTEPNYEERGPYGVGIQSFDVPGADDRMVRVTVWYPSDTEDGPIDLHTVVSEANAQTLQELVAAAPPECVRSTLMGTAEAPLAEGSFPAIVFSHCLSCLGVSSSFITERLASHGSIVIGVTHTDDTLFDQLEGTVAPLDGDWLAVRTLDASLALDGVLAMAPYDTAIDQSRLGIFGHSYGATTTGKVLQDDDRFIAGVAMAAPVENPLLPGVTVDGIAEPMLMLLAQEDNSITEVGNNFMRTNAMTLSGGSWLVEVADAGHWSFSDLCGIIEAFQPGCGEGIRQTMPGEAFTYLDADLGRQIAASYVTAFFALHLQDDAAAADYLDVGTPSDVVTVERFP
ncbi:MAG: prolyl oligopeptidase family serine peptidase [Myxococcota bacterium]